MQAISNAQVQMDLLSEVRDFQELIQNILTRERTRKNQQMINSTHTHAPNGKNIKYIQRNRVTNPRKRIWPTPENTKITDFGK